MSVKILNFNIYDGSKLDLMNYIEKFNKVHIISGNPEVLTNGMKNKTLYDNFKSENSVIIPDGIGVVIASKIVGNPVKEKVAGIEVMDEILKKCNMKKKSVYLLGAKEDIVVKCKEVIEKKYPHLIVSGFHNGYFDIENCEDIIKDIKAKKPYAVFIAMGSPKQEEFISEYMKDLPCNIFMGVGGSFDIFAGNVKRAPQWMIKSGLEWLYRVVKEPKRIKRLVVIPKFLIKVIFSERNVGR